MRIACLSGKGGAGKTFVAVNLAAVAETCTYIDCDVEEPNGRLFWKPQGVETTPVSLPLPQFDEKLCIGCKKCVEFCRFHALVYIKDKPMLFPQVCHSCGGCQIICPQGAISQQGKEVGVIEIGHSGNVKVVTGVLNMGEASGVPVIHQALHQAEGLTILDCPPGSACSVMETVMDADYCLLVAEPTAFGLHNIQMVHELVTLLGRPCGLVVNKESAPYLPLEQFCQENNIPILARFPYDPILGQQIADGQIAVHQNAQLRECFTALLHQIGGTP